MHVGLKLKVKKKIYLKKFNEGCKGINDTQKKFAGLILNLLGNF